MGAFIAGTEVAKKQGFFGAAMLPMSELEYTSIMSKLDKLDERFKLRRAPELDNCSEAVPV